MAESLFCFPAGNGGAMNSTPTGLLIDIGYFPESALIKTVSDWRDIAPHAVYLEQLCRQQGRKASSLNPEGGARRDE